MSRLSDGKCRATAHFAANNRAETAHIFWTGPAGHAGERGENRPPQREGAARFRKLDKGCCRHERDSLTANHVSTPL
jgi:hypothetical protein